MTKLLITAICASILALAALAKEVVLPNTQIRKISSKMTKQRYRIYVNVPASYLKKPRDAYPAIFVLDADYSFALAKQISEHLSDRKRIPEVFIFGIAYENPKDYRLNRTRDYTPSFQAEGGYSKELQKHSGGGPKFAEFIETELMPYLAKNFRISKNRTLVGHSFGGLFSSWVLITKPKLFENYIIVSPSLWYDKKLMFSLAKQYTESGKVFFGIGSKETKSYGTEHPMIEDLNEFIALLRSKSKNSLVEFVLFEKENHDTVFPAGLTRGLVYVLEEGAKQQTK